MPCEGLNSDLMHDVHNEVAAQGMTAPAMSSSATVEEVKMQLVRFVAFFTALSVLAIAVRLPQLFWDDAHPMQQKSDGGRCRRHARVDSGLPACGLSSSR